MGCLKIVMKCPPSRAGRGVKCPSRVFRGGMFKLPFDWYIILDIIEYSVLFIFSGDDGM